MAIPELDYDFLENKEMSTSQIYNTDFYIS